MRHLLPTRAQRQESGRLLPVLYWRFSPPVRSIASGPLGGGIGIRNWVLNATIDKAYDRLDPDVHLEELAAYLGLAGPGVGMLTAVDVDQTASAHDDGGVSVVATVGLSHPTWAAAADGDRRYAARPGTINVVALLPVPLTDAALVNAVATAAEAKAQALWENGVEATGTASDALFVASSIATPGVRPEPYGGPRSTWGARLARAVHAAVGEGTARWLGGPRSRSERRLG